MVIHALRYFVLWTSRSPLFYFYVWLYKLIISMVTFTLSKNKGIIAIYLSRGCAKDDIIPGISDIDLYIITDKDDANKMLVEKKLQKIAKLTHNLVEYTEPAILSIDTLQTRWKGSPLWQYRYKEGKVTWKLLYGDDVLKSLPELTERQCQNSNYAELNHWWVRFVNIIFQKKCYKNKIMRNVMCYKVVCESLNTWHALQTGEFRYKRIDAFQTQESYFLKKILQNYKNNFLTSDDDLLQETYHFLLNFFVDIWNTFEEKPFLWTSPDITQKVDITNLDNDITEQDQENLEFIYNNIDLWKKKYIKKHLVKSVFWDFDEILLIVDIDYNTIPSIEELISLIDLHKKIYSKQIPKIFIFLRLGYVGFPLTPVIPEDYRRGFLSPANTPDIFLQLDHQMVYWTDYTNWYLTKWQTNEMWELPSKKKQKQLEIITETVEKRRIIYPLTSTALDKMEKNKKRFYA